MKLVWMSALVCLNIFSASYAMADADDVRDISCVIEKSSDQLEISSDGTDLKSVLFNGAEVKSNCSVTMERFQYGEARLQCKLDSRHSLDIEIGNKMQLDENALGDFMNQVLSLGPVSQDAYQGALSTSTLFGTRISKIVCDDKK